ncbi:SIR2 family NAD-dependent protein deacylase [Azoarcus olearius]|uniref:protein acetyllysine N-acetyltransferase n=1 Tax=Azoarcus sp. (strain BH72) TaxID=418699 RepID=A1K1Z9_AZOSB|nr:putative NAD-dependent deacetylase [Azoarcus olearius]
MTAPPPSTLHAAAQDAAAALAGADALLVTAGAGMGVDSGLPDFRGAEGFWRAYPALRQTGLRFEEIADPVHFERDPALAWGFYGHRLALYRRTVPHAGFGLLRELGRALAQGVFVFTSNVDGQFQRAGFDADRIVEVHGSIHHLQCIHGCRDAIWPADAFAPDVNEATCRLSNPPPRCPHCGAVARPNILMFGDWGWLEERSAAQQARLADWLDRVQRPLVVEIGAGTAIPTVRRVGERAGATLVRINPQADRDPPPGSIALHCGGLAGIRALHAAAAAAGLVGA